jgi:hypothetical protein
MTGHPEPGALRAWLDGERPDLARHLRGCTACRERSAGQASAARLAATALADPPAFDLDVEAALAAVRPATALAPVVPLRRPDRRPARVGRAAAAVVLLTVVGAVVATPGGRASAGALLERFRAEQVAVVPVDIATVDPTALEVLADVAGIEGPQDVVDPQEVADLAEAEEVSGIAATPLDLAALPEGVTGPVRIAASAPRTVRLEIADDADLPADVRAATLVLQVPGAVVQAVPGEDGPVALRGEAGTLEVSVEGGPTLAEVRDALLGLPGLPPETVAALRGIEDWETTLPLPVPAGRIPWQETTVDGRPALAFGDQSGLGSALLWRDGDRFVGVGGRLPLSASQRLAEAG